ncbi:sensor histidine kinase [Dictyobacter formicarum]|uniref:Histidine kinase n=1 Tax=Dictyobacter formicarum TaxID=2778368 RepID=A0ABQ3V9M6_9CHLR|nr:sensor histidine kinase [Dictyobacter formicarum]GHO82630.1 histidine kinase [Dictyobacter formicarum]
MKNRFLTKEPLRWFLLLWVAMAVTGALLGSTVHDGLTHGGSVQNTIHSGVYIMTLSPSPTGSKNLPPPLQLQSGFFLEPPLSFSSTLIFLLLVAFYGFLLWRGLSGKVRPRFFWLYFLCQGLFVVAMQWVVEQPNLTLNFYLVLTLCAVAMLKRTVPVLLIGMSYLLLFFVSLSINLPFGVLSGTHLATIWFSFWSFSDLTTIVFFVLGYLLLYVQQSSAQRELEQAHLELQGAYSSLAASSKQIETLTLLTERQRIARELHDTLAQGIAGMIMQLEVISAQMHRKNYLQVQQVLSQMLSYARTTLQDARHAITDLRYRTPRVDQLVESVQEEIAHFFQMTGIACHSQLDDLIHTPTHACEHVLRVIGEGLSNVARHAQARRVSVEARVVERWLSITVHDDGQGFDPANQTLFSGHYGLLGLQERANLLEGALSVNSSDGEGTTLEFRIPLATSGHPVPPPSLMSSSSSSVGEQNYA